MCTSDPVHAIEDARYGAHHSLASQGPTIEPLHRFSAKTFSNGQDVPLAGAALAAARADAEVTLHEPGPSSA